MIDKTLKVKSLLFRSLKPHEPLRHKAAQTFGFCFSNYLQS